MTRRKYHILEVSRKAINLIFETRVNAKMFDLSVCVSNSNCHFEAVKAVHETRNGRHNDGTKDRVDGQEEAAVRVQYMSRYGVVSSSDALWPPLLVSLHRSICDFDRLAPLCGCTNILRAVDFVSSWPCLYQVMTTALPHCC